MSHLTYVVGAAQTTSSFRINTWLQYIVQRQLQDEAGNIYVFGFVAPCTGGLTVFVKFNIMFVCLFVSLLSHFWLIHFCPPAPALSTISRPLSSSMCSITPETTNVGSSYNRMRGPGIGCWFSDRSNRSHWSLTLTFTLTSENLSLYTTLLLVLVLIHLDSNYCRTRCRQSQPRFVLSPLLLHPRLLGTFQSDIPLFTLTWPAKHSPNQGWESTHRLHLYPLGGVFYSP